MKNLIALGCVAFALWGVYACTQTPVTPDETATASARAGATEATSGTALAGFGSLTTVAVANLPGVITTFISTSYAGATINQANVSATGVFVVFITINSISKVLVFNANGTFSQELRAGRHHGPHSGTATRPGNGTATHPHSGTITHPHNGTATRPHNGTATHPHSGTNGGGHGPKGPKPTKPVTTTTT